MVVSNDRDEAEGRPCPFLFSVICIVLHHAEVYSTCTTLLFQLRAIVCLQSVMDSKLPALSSGCVYISQATGFLSVFSDDCNYCAGQSHVPRKMGIATTELTAA